MTSPAPLFFFLSFAGDNEPDKKLVATLFDNLRDEVRHLAGLQAADPAPTGFLSIASLRLGEDWSAQIADALGTCRVFLALYAPPYFKSPWCGVEWQAFTDRLAQHHCQTGERAPCLLPVAWTPMEPMQMPAVAASIQYSDSQLPDEVRTIGLRRIMREKLEPQYARAVTALATLIVRVGTRYAVTPMKIGHDHRSLPRAFPDPVTRPVADSCIPKQRPPTGYSGTTLPDLDGDTLPIIRNT